jgi:polygalacturonase
MNPRHLLALCGVLLGLVGCELPWSHPGSGGIAGVYDVRGFGAAGDGITLDTDAVNQAIDAAHAVGGGTVRFPAGTYRCFSIHLQSNVALYLDQGATIEAAPPPPRFGITPCYDAPEDNPSDKYQDFGHTHWHNSLIWGENLENIAILGPGTIDGSKGLTRRGTSPVGSGVNSIDADPPGTNVKPPTTQGTRPEPELFPNAKDTVRSGMANKAIALKLCRNVVMRDFTIFAGGHFAILATGVDNFTLDNLKLDTNRDGMDIDSCKNVRISNCTVNSPFDDGICLKADFGLGYNRTCENVTITNCQVSGYFCGSLLDGTYRPIIDKDGKEKDTTGRIKFGTEANGGFRNITISNCVFDHCRGLALEQVDGGPLEDVAISNITMRHIHNSPIFLRLGARLRGPAGTTVGTLKRVNISNVVIYDADPRYSSIITGIPGYDIADIQLSHIQIFCRGGSKQKWATTQTWEDIRAYPEPDRLHETAAYGFFIRHVNGIEFNDVKLHFEKDESRAPFVLKDVSNAQFNDVSAQHAPWASIFVLTSTQGVSIHNCDGLTDTLVPAIDQTTLGGREATTTPTTEPNINFPEPPDPLLYP